MANVINYSKQLVIGTVVLERLSQVAVPPMLRPHVAALESAHADFDSAVARTTHARASRKTGVDIVATADDSLGQSLQDLAGAIVASRLGTLRAPFASFGGKALSYYAKGSRVRAAKDAMAVIAAIESSEAPDVVRKAASKCKKHCRAVTTAYVKLGAERVSFRQARGKRQTAFETFAAALTDTRNIAKVAWRDRGETYGVVFGPVERDRFGKKTVHKKGAKADPTADAPATQPAQPTQPVVGAPVVSTPPPSPTIVTSVTTAPKTNGAGASLVS